MSNEVARLSLSPSVARIDEGAASSEAPLVAQKSGFRSLDAIARDPGSSGLVSARAPRASLEALRAHLTRRARSIGRVVVSVEAAPWDDVWRELSARLGATPSADPVAIAASIIARAQGAVVVVLDSNPSSWGRAVAQEIGRALEAEGAGGHERGNASTGRPLFLHLSDVSPDPSISARSLVVDGIASPADIRCWWDAASQDIDDLFAARVERLDALEGWWAAVRATPKTARPEPTPLSADASKLLKRLLLSRRSWTAEAAERLGSSEARAELVDRGVLSLDPHGRLLGPTSPFAAPTAANDDLPQTELILVAEALEAAFRSDPWALMRASELYALGGDATRAEIAAERAILDVFDSAARADFWGRWEASLAIVPQADAAARLLRAAELAHRAGDVERAYSFANAAVARSGESFEALLTLGRATAARGDITTAVIVLDRAMQRAEGSFARARAAVETAEAQYTAGDLAGAQANAELGLTSAGDLATRLQARNVLGKLHLAAARWDMAEQHFAADECEATCGGDVVGALRARVNRAIALLSSDRHDEARSMLLSVLEESESRGDPNAVAFALTNLSTLAIKRHEYADALRFGERAFELRRRIGDKIRIALLITNLAELRLRVGFVAEAEQALAFGRRAYGPAMPAARAAQFALTAARIHLARGDTQSAAAEASSALASARGSSNGDKVCECHRVAARIALDDGDIPRASAAIEGARATASARYAKAEVALLSAMRARAAGEDFFAMAQEALTLAREVSAIELQREAHILVYHASVAAGDLRNARAHVQAAKGIRDRLASTIADDRRPRFLARRDLAELALIERLLAAEDAEDLGYIVPDRTGSSPEGGALARGMASDAKRPAGVPAIKRMVGRDPAMLALARVVTKVGQSDAPVLIHGESGTGKELVAEAIHEAGQRRGKPLVKVNCAALVEGLLLSELFGHEKGSFTGAVTRRRGRFEAAEGGTLFLDEIGDISSRTQVALLRVLEDKTFERVGSVTPIRADVRIICATHRDLRAMVARGEFREDLYYRLRGVVLEVPALRQRAADIPLIAEAILDRIATSRGGGPKRLSPRALEALAGHAWPGNIRELENALDAASLFAESSVIELDDLLHNVDGLTRTARHHVERPAPASSPAEEERAFEDVVYEGIRGGVSLSDITRNIRGACIKRALEESDGNITRAAEILGMKRPRLSQLVKELGLGLVSED